MNHIFGRDFQYKFEYLVKFSDPGDLRIESVLDFLKFNCFRLFVFPDKWLGRAGSHKKKSYFWQTAVDSLILPEYPLLPRVGLLRVRPAFRDGPRLTSKDQMKRVGRQPRAQSSGCINSPKLTNILEMFASRRERRRGGGINPRNYTDRNFLKYIRCREYLRGSMKNTSSVRSVAPMF